MAGEPGPPGERGPPVEPPEPRSEPRPLVERLGLGAIAVVLAGVFGALGAAALASGEVFLGTMAGIGAVMTVWAAASGLRKG